MLRSSVILLIPILCNPSLRAADNPTPFRTVTGRVILDLNRNGQLDPGEKGLPNILITDGIQFVRTAADGSYSIKLADDPFIPHKNSQVLTMSWPTGYWPVGRQWFVRIGDLKPGQTVDFFLRPDKQQLPFTFVHGTDPHNSFADSERFRDDVDRMGDRVNLCFITGDLGYAGRDDAERAFAKVRDFTRAFPVPMLHVPGNHDICDIHTEKWSEDVPLAGYGPYLKLLGPIRWSFDYAGIHLVGLDWARIKEDKTLQTGASDTTIAFLEEDLKHVKPGARIIVFMHHHHRHDDDKLWDVLVKHKVELMVAGHSHLNLDQSRRGVKAFTTMNLRGPYRLVTLKEQGHDIVNRCFGCKDPTYHSKKCALADPPNPNRGPLVKSIENLTIDAPFPLDAPRAKSFDLLADIDPGAAQSVGLRLVPTDPKAKTIELKCTADNDLFLGPIRTAALRGREQKDFHLHLVLADGKARLHANGRAQLETPLEPGTAYGVTLFAEGGRGTFKSVDAWEFQKK